MGANNSFKKLMAEEEAQNPAPLGVEQKLTSNLSFLDFFGKTIELFVPNIVNMFITMAGGTVEQLKGVELPDFLPEEGEADRDEISTPGDAASDV